MTSRRTVSNASCRAAAVLLLTVAVLMAAPGGAWADPAGPTNYDSEVTGLDPSVEGIEAEVYGGDAFIRVVVEPGHELLVAGYEDDPAASPFLRVDADGNVFVNRRSPAAYLNAARYGSRDVTVPAGLDPEAPPAWEQVATGGDYAWHDHRIHWMSPSVPPQVDEDADVAQEVTDWRVPVLVDGEPVDIRGQLEWLPSRSPLLPGAVALLALAAAALAVRGRRTATLVLSGAAGAVGVALGLADLLAAPTGAEADPLMTALPAIALGAAVAAFALRRRGERPAVLLAVLAAVPLLVWVVLQLGVFTAPTLVGAAPDAVVRYGVAAVLGIALGVLGAGGASLVEPLEPPVSD